MTKEWFTNIVKCYPKAYYQCLFYFKDNYPKEWKEMMRNPDCLIEFFASKQIVVKIEEKFNNLAEQSRFRFSVAGRFIQESGYEFERFAFAQWAGLEFAFMLLNFQIRQAEKVKIEKFERIKRPKR